jgi:hypothetical protein
MAFALFSQTKTSDEQKKESQLTGKGLVCHTNTQINTGIIQHKIHILTGPMIHLLDFFRNRLNKKLFACLYM